MSAYSPLQMNNGTGPAAAEAMLLEQGGDDAAHAVGSGGSQQHRLLPKPVLLAVGGVLALLGAATGFHSWTSSHAAATTAKQTVALSAVDVVAPAAAAPAGKSGPTVEADIEPCSEEVSCPMEWFSAPKGGYYCRTDSGCSPWSPEGGFFDAAACADQCSIGVVPLHSTTPAPPATAADGDAAAADGGGESHPGGSAGKPAPAGPAVDPNNIQPCDPEEEAKCPDDWVSGEFGGFYCRQGDGCSPWSKHGGAFPPEVCPDQCAIGNTPSTITRTTTSTSLTTTSITSTYPGMGIKLYCWSLAQPGYEFDILRRQKELYAGIFACDFPTVVTFDPMSLGDGDDKFDSITCERVEVGTSKDGTAANSLQFMKAWDSVHGQGKYKKADWSVKVDPDAVLLPDRLRIHLNPYNGGNVYVRNCNKPMSEGTMMFGALEALSTSALEGYYANFAACENEVPWQEWGEDLFMMRCLEHVGVGVAEDYSIIQDGVCNGVWCGDNNAAAFHPMKDVPAWEACWNEAVASR